MSKTAEFKVMVGQGSAKAFAELSGDWNPLHTDADYAATTTYGQPILHGAFSAGLVSRMAGMHLPGESCLLHGMRLRFVAPVVPPAKLVVRGVQVASNRVEVTVDDADKGMRCVEASYEFGLHEQGTAQPAVDRAAPNREGDGQALVLVTGASGGLGSAFLDRLGAAGVGVSQSGNRPGALVITDPAQTEAALAGRSLAGIVHCGWPAPANQPLLDLAAPLKAVTQHVAQPLAECIGWAQVLARHGVEDAALILVGSTFARPGRHQFRMPLYSLAKSMLPCLSEILALELGARELRCIGVAFDVIQGGMNQGLAPATFQAHADRSPSGQLATPASAADQLMWVLENRSHLLSGATITLSGGALP
jgi:NAD(P)-dependent dehydrogenase (short-subunit alcohol dehydrogenase family)